MSNHPFFLKVIGERNCGTNYLEQLWRENFRVKILRGNPHHRFPAKRFEWSNDLYFSLTGKWNLGWKHAMAPPAGLIQKHPEAQNLGLVALVKNPYSFLLSLFRKPYQYQGGVPESFKAFLSTPWKSTRRERWEGGFFENPIVLWNEKNRSFQDLSNALSMVQLIRYEDLLGHPEAVIRKQADFFGLEMGAFKNIERSTKEEKERTFDSYQRYYLEEEWRSALMEEEIDLINRSLDHDLVRSFGYAIIEQKNAQKG